jgi:CheY-like chemotaxis protein
MRCLIVDDDLGFTNLVTELLQEDVAVLRGNIDHILNEKALLKRLDEPFAYDFVILDIMVRWTDMNDPETAPIAAGGDGYFGAGIRCMAAIRNLPNGAEIPIFINSARDRSDIEDLMQAARLPFDNVRIFPKDGDFPPLIAAVKELNRKVAGKRKQPEKGFARG